MHINNVYNFVVPNKINFPTFKITFSILVGTKKTLFGQVVHENSQTV